MWQTGQLGGRRRPDAREREADERHAQPASRMVNGPMPRALAGHVQRTGARRGPPAGRTAWRTGGDRNPIARFVRVGRWDSIRQCRTTARGALPSVFGFHRVVSPSVGGRGSLAPCLPPWARSQETAARATCHAMPSGHGWGVRVFCGCRRPWAAARERAGRSAARAT